LTHYFTTTNLTVHRKNLEKKLSKDSPENNNNNLPKTPLQTSKGLIWKEKYPILQY
jgi:hypothetical protein